jgi:hypothetical protein
VVTIDSCLYDAGVAKKDIIYLLQTVLIVGVDLIYLTIYRIL